MIDLYFWPTPNGHKATIALEEMGLEYRVHPINILREEQFSDHFLSINPNHKIPAIVDPGGPDGKSFSLFESGAILMYLAEKSGKFWPADKTERYRVFEWLFFQCTSLGPLLGQCGHFLGYAPEKVPYAMTRYHNETKRLYGVMDGVLAEREFLAGDYSIADMATYPWIMPKIRELHDMEIEDYPNVRRWHDTIEARPAVKRGVAVLESEMKIGDPDDDAFESLFGSPQKT